MKHYKCSHAPLTLAVLAALGMGTTASAQEFLDIDDLVNPRSSVRAGMGYIDDDSRWYGEYSGFVDYGEKGFAPLFDLDYVTRENESGTWVRGDVDVSRRGSLGFGVEKQGDWKAAIDYQRITKNNPLIITTPLTGIGTPDQDVAGTTPRRVDLELERDDYRLELGKMFGNGFGGHVTFRELNKEGNRNWGDGFGYNFFTEPVDYTIRELDAVVDYSASDFSFRGGIYGSSFDNANKVVTAAGSGQGSAALPLDNSSLQAYLSGAYAFTPTTRINFKFAQSEAKQDETFFTPASLNSRTDLGGEVETTLAYAGLSSRPIEKVSLSATVRYEDREDNTPVEQYVNDDGVPDGTRDGNNVPHSRETLNWKVEAGYQLPMGFDLIGGFEWHDIERSRPPETSTLYADNTTESYRIELRRSMNELLNGSFSYTFSDRESDDRQRSGFDPADWVAVSSMADRERDQYRLRLDWTPSQVLAVQFTFQYTDDEYDTGLAPYGVQEGNSKLASVDVSYRINDDWSVTGWLTRDQTTWEQFTGGADWTSDIEYTGNSAGLGLRGTVNWVHKVGADVQYSRDESRYAIDVADDLPDVEYKYWRFNLWGNYVIDENSGLRADWIYTRYENDDWTWDEFQYADGTTVVLPDDEDVNFLGVRFYYKWR